MKYKCVTCDGTGEVHSHNPKCWDCNGTGSTDKGTAEAAIRREVMPEVAKVRQLSGKAFGKAEQDAFVAEYLQPR